MATPGKVTWTSRPPPVFPCGSSCARAASRLSKTGTAVGTNGAASLSRRCTSRILDSGVERCVQLRLALGEPRQRLDARGRFLETPIRHLQFGMGAKVLDVQQEVGHEQQAQRRKGIQVAYPEIRTLIKPACLLIWYRWYVRLFVLR